MKDAIQYKVTVEAVIRRVELVGKEWKPKNGDPKEPFAYTPETEKTVERSVQIFEQTLDHLELSDLVAVINGLPAKAKTGSASFFVMNADMGKPAAFDAGN